MIYEIKLPNDESQTSNDNYMKRKSNYNKYNEFQLAQLVKSMIIE